MNDGASETTQQMRVEVAKGKAVSPLLKLALEFGPLAIFFFANSYGDRLFGVAEDRRIFVATGIFIVASLVALALSRVLMGYLPRMAIVNAIVVTVFGGLTLVLHDETFIKWKPTILYWTLALGLAGSSLFFGKNLIRALLGDQVTLPEDVWRKLNWSWIGFFTFMGFANLAVAFLMGFSTDTWVNFKLFGGMGLMLIFALAQGLLLSKYIDEDNK